VGTELPQDYIQHGQTKVSSCYEDSWKNWLTRSMYTVLKHLVNENECQEEAEKWMVVM